MIIATTASGFAAAFTLKLARAPPPTHLRPS
jgi:hypothetical protein